MENIRNKYEIVLSVFTLVLSLSVFKDELSVVQLELGYITISFSKYFLMVVLGFSLSLYLYVIENMLRDTRIGKWKVFDYVLQVAYFIVILILISPVILILNVIIYKVIVFLLNKESAARNTFIMILPNLLGMIFSIILSKISLNKLKKKAKEDIEEQEIKELNNATKLFSDGYYSHSILESFKVLETHLYKRILSKDLRAPRNRINDIIDIAIKEKMINQIDLNEINNIKKMRNEVAHSNISYTKIQAEQVLNFVKKFLCQKLDEM